MKTKLNKQTFTSELSQELVRLLTYFYEYILLLVFFSYNRNYLVKITISRTPAYLK